MPDEILVEFGVAGRRAHIAPIMESGSADIPARPAIGKAVEKIMSNKKLQEDVMRLILEGKYELAGKRVGEAGVFYAKSKIESKTLAKNADSTISKKGFNFPLVDEGIYHANIANRVLVR